MKRYEQIPHTADLAAKIYGKDINGLFENAAYAAFDIIGNIEGLVYDKTLEVCLESPDTESLLVKWLNELFYRSYTEDVLFGEFKILSIENNKLTAKAKGQVLNGKYERIEQEIKAATYHDLKIKETDEGYEVTVVFDV